MTDNSLEKRLVDAVVHPQDLAADDVEIPTDHRHEVEQLVRAAEEMDLRLAVDRQRKALVWRSEALRKTDDGFSIAVDVENPEGREDPQDLDAEDSGEYVRTPWE